MNYIVGAAGVVAAFLIMAVSMAINARNGMALVDTEFDKLVVMAVAVFADVAKAVAWIFLMTAITRRQVLASLASGLMFGVCMLYATVGCLGYFAAHRAQSTARTVETSELAKDIDDAKRRKQSQLDALGVITPVSVVAKRIEGMKQNVRFVQSRQCTDVTTAETRKFCMELAGVEAEEKKSLAAAVIEGELVALQTRREQLGRGVRVSEGDFQSRLLAQITKAEMSTIQLSLTILVVLVIEGGACLFLGLALNHFESTRREIGEQLRGTVAAIAEAGVTVEPAVAGEEKVVSSVATPPPAAAERKVTTDNVVMIQRPEKTPAEPLPVAVATVRSLEAFAAEFLDLEDALSLSVREVAECYTTWCRRKKLTALAGDAWHAGIAEMCAATGIVVRGEGDAARLHGVGWMKRKGRVDGLRG